MNTPHKLKYVYSLALTFTMAAQANAALVFSDNFESYSTGQLTDNTIWDGISNGATEQAQSGTVFIKEDSGNLFGQGTGNKYVDLWDNSNPDGSPNSIWMTNDGLNLTGGVLTLSMNVIEPTGTATGRILIGIGDGIMSGNDRANNINWNENDGADNLFGNPTDDADNVSTFGGVTVTRGTLYNLNVVYNNNAGNITYSSLTGTNDQTLDGLSADIWIDGVLVAENVQQDRFWDGDATIDSVGFRSFSGDIQRLLVDDIRVYDEAVVVPEPASAAMLLGMTVTAFAMIRRRRR